MSDRSRLSSDIVADARSQNEAPASPGSLEYRSKLPSQEGEAYVRLYPTAGEASATVIPWWLQLAGKKRAPAARTASSHQRTANARRAAASVRRFVRANGLEFLWTATYADAPADRATVVEHLRRFFERAQRRWGRMPIVAVIERGKKNGRLHVHFAVERWLCHKCMRKTWGHGFVWVGDPGQLAGRTGARQLAGYLSKYVTKDVRQEVDDGVKPERGSGHRYAVTEGWAPEERRFVTWDLPRALAYLADRYGAADRVVEWADDGIQGVYGVWLSYPDAIVNGWRAPPPGELALSSQD